MKIQKCLGTELKVTDRLLHTERGSNGAATPRLYSRVSSAQPLETLPTCWPLVRPRQTRFRDSDPFAPPTRMRACRMPHDSCNCCNCSFHFHPQQRAYDVSFSSSWFFASGFSIFIFQPLSSIEHDLTETFEKGDSSAHLHPSSGQPLPYHYSRDTVPWEAALVTEAR